MSKSEKFDDVVHVPAITPETFYNRNAVETDSRPVPEFLREARTYEGGSYQVPIDRFISQEYHDLEVEKLWKRVWQVACREEEIPEVGDTLVYEIATLEFIIVRTAPDTIKAYPNSCLHRGRRLVDGPKRAGQFRCPFHGFTWDLEGRIAQIPCAWEFSHVQDPEKWHLPGVKVGTWGGFVFINPDKDAEPLKDFLGDIDRHYEGYPLQDRYISAHARKVIPCNWKIAQEAFLEAFHVMGTHPQLLPQGSQTDMKYDVYGNFSRTIGVYYVPNIYTNYDPTNQDILDSVVDRRLDQDRTVLAKEGYTVRQQMAEMARQGYERATGKSADQFSDTELIDVCFMSIFPNIHPWTFFSRIAYQFRPHKNDPNKSVMDLYQLVPFDEKKGRPPAVPVHILSEDGDWTEAAELGVYWARIANQDQFNLGAVQEGMKSSATKVVNYSSYQESRIRHFHDLLDKWLGK